MGELVGILVLRETDAVGSHVVDDVGDVVGAKFVVVMAVKFFSSLAYEVVVEVVEVDLTDGDVDVGFVVVVVIVVL